MKLIILFALSIVSWAKPNPQHDLTAAKLTEIGCGAVFFSGVLTSNSQSAMLETPVFTKAVDAEVKAIETKYTKIVTELPANSPDSKKSEALSLVYNSVNKVDPELAAECMGVMEIPVDKCFSLYQSGSDKTQYENCARSNINAQKLQALMSKVIRVKKTPARKK